MHDLAQSWCQMWNDDADLAHKLVSGDFRMWFGSTANGDQVRGAGDLAQFVGRYQREQGARFTPRLIVEDEQAQRLAYTWDAARPDGSVVGGIDVYTLFAKHRDPVIDVAAQLAAFTWTATLPLGGGEQRTLGGIDLFQITGCKFSRCWSVTGARPFTF